MNPFSAHFSEGFPQLLYDLGGSIMLSTYQGGKVMLISSDGERLIQLVRDFQRPMGISIHKDMLALALVDNVSVFRSTPALASSYPGKEGCYDALYYPSVTYKTGFIDTHDVAFTNSGILAVNTAYSCLARVDTVYSFQPVWKPFFIKELKPGDACHLNGLCVSEEGEPAYVSAFAQSTEPQGWRVNKLRTGVLMDVEQNRVIADTLPMPHSPRLYKDELYLLLSATEEFVRMDRESGEYEVIARLDGFIRGLSFYKNYAFIGISKLRKSHTFSDLPIAKKRLLAGVAVVDIEQKEKVGEILYDGGLEEIYDLHFLQDSKRPNILNHPMSREYPAVLMPEGESWITNKGERDAQRK